MDNRDSTFDPNLECYAAASIHTSHTVNSYFPGLTRGSSNVDPGYEETGQRFYKVKFLKALFKLPPAEK